MRKDASMEGGTVYDVLRGKFKILYFLFRVPYLSLKAAVILNSDTRERLIKLENYNN